MQPVVEFRITPQGLYEYSIRAPRSHGVVPPPSFVQSGFGTLQECLVDAARGLTPRFQRVYVRYQGMCVGEEQLRHLLVDAERIASEFGDRLARLAPAEAHSKDATDSAESSGTTSPSPLPA
jgi:hypothetical protein